MRKTLLGQTKEEWLKERERERNLTPEERQRELDEYIKANNEKWKQINVQKQEKYQQQITQKPFENCDHPNSLENDEATIIWVIVMAIGTIFKGNWIIWIIATIVWRRYITRHKIKK